MAKKTTKKSLVAEEKVQPRLITNSRITNWQVQQLNEWDGRHKISLMSNPETVSLSMPVSDAKQAENAQQMDVVNWHLDRVGVERVNNIGQTLSLLQRVKRLQAKPGDMLREGDAVWLVNEEARRHTKATWCDEVRDTIGREAIKFYSSKQEAEAVVEKLKAEDKAKLKAIRGESTKQDTSKSSGSKRKVRKQPAKNK